MSNILTVITQNILPIFVVAAFGFGLQRWRHLDKRSFSSAALNVFSPCLVFSSLVNSQIPGGELAGIAFFTVLNVVAMGMVGYAAARLLRLPRQQTAALMVVVMFVNGGNYGMTLNQLRYGNDGLARAVIYFLTSSIMLYTLGIFIATSGQMSLKAAVRKLATFPAVYAAVGAVLVYNLDIAVPGPLMRGIEIAGAAAIPVLLLILGMQLADLRGRPSLQLTVPAVGLRLLVGPLIGVLVAGLIGLTGLNRSVSIIEASMPTAVFTIVLATEFDLVPPAVTSIVVFSTLASPFTIAAVITILGL